MVQASRPAALVNCPVGHPAHWLMPALDANRPALHLAQVLRPSTLENRPFAQAVQTEVPTAGWKFPGWQARHWLLPVCELKVPALHWLHVLAADSAWKVPGSQRVHEARPPSEYPPATQEEQAVACATKLIVPAGHAWHPLGYRERVPTVQAMQLDLLLFTPDPKPHVLQDAAPADENW